MFLVHASYNTALASWMIVEANQHTSLSLGNMPCSTQLVYLGMSFSLTSRVLFVMILYRNKSKNRISFFVCLLNAVANAFWIPYAHTIHSPALMVRSAVDACLSSLGAIYVCHNRWFASPSQRDASRVQQGHPLKRTAQPPAQQGGFG